MGLTFRRGGINQRDIRGPGPVSWHAVAVKRVRMDRLVTVPNEEQSRDTACSVLFVGCTLCSRAVSFR